MIKKFSILLTVVLSLGLLQGEASAYWQENEEIWSSYESEPVQSGNLRSRREVIQEVKRRYNNAEVLKITLDERRQVYKVRILMPNGKVRNLTIDARR